MKTSEQTGRAVEISRIRAPISLTSGPAQTTIVQIVQPTKHIPFLTTRQLADSLGVSESSIKRWVDDGTIAADRTAGGHRRISLAAAIRFIRKQGSSVVQPNLLPFQTPPRVLLTDREAIEELHEALLHDRPQAARAIIGGRYLRGADVAAIADGMIKPVFERLGELWRHGPEGILLEHRAVDSCLHALSEIGSWVPEPPEDAPTAVVAGAPGDPYLLPPMLAGMVLREGGIRAHNLGPFTPLEAVSVAMTRYRATLCSISVSAPPAGKTEQAWHALERAAAEAGARVVVGGRNVGALPARVRDGVRVCGSMAEFSAYASGWLEGVRGAARKGG